MENKYRKEDSNIQINRVGLSTKYNVVSENIFLKMTSTRAPESKLGSGSVRRADSFVCQATNFIKK